MAFCGWQELMENRRCCWPEIFPDMSLPMSEVLPSANQLCANEISIQG